MQIRAAAVVRRRSAARIIIRKPYHALAALYELMTDTDKRSTLLTGLNPGLAG